MRIDSNNSYLSLEKVEHVGRAVVWQVAAAVAHDGCLAAVHSRTRVHTTSQTPEKIADFAACRAQRFELMLSRGGWLRVRRCRGGRALVRYRLAQWGAGASLEGRVRLERGSAEAFCRELGGLL
jgi:hypothetical protein